MSLIIAFHKDRMFERTSTCTTTSNVRLMLCLITHSVDWLIYNCYISHGLRICGNGSSLCNNYIYAHYQTQHLKCNSSQFEMAQLNPPPCPMSPLLYFTDPDVRLQSLGPGLANDTSLAPKNKPPVCSCHGEKKKKVSTSTIMSRSCNLDNRSPGPTPMYCLPFQ